MQVCSIKDSQEQTEVGWQVCSFGGWTWHGLLLWKVLLQMLSVHGQHWGGLSCHRHRRQRTWFLAGTFVDPEWTRENHRGIANEYTEIRYSLCLECKVFGSSGPAKSPPEVGGDLLHHVFCRFAVIASTKVHQRWDLWWLGQRRWRRWAAHEPHSH